MNEIGEKFLPIGTVVLLKEGTKRVMITGFCSAAEEDPNKVWDYTGCPYPEGYISSNQTCMFNHDQINTVNYVGFKDDPEEIAFKETLKKLFEALQNGTPLSDVEIPAQKAPEAPQALVQAPVATPVDVIDPFNS